MLVSLGKRIGVAITLLIAPVACSFEPPAAPAASELAEPAIERAGATLQMTLSEDGRLSSVVVSYLRRADQVGPRAVELILQRSHNLILRASEPLGAASSAEKRLVVQERDDDLRVILFSTSSLEPLESGPLVRLELERTDDEVATLSLANTGSTFAPAEANWGFVPPEALVIGGPR